MFRIRYVLVVIIAAILAGLVFFLYPSSLGKAQQAADARQFEQALTLLTPSLESWWPRSDSLLLGARTARRAGQQALADKFLRRYQESGGDAEIIAIERILSGIQRGEMTTFTGGLSFCEKHPQHPEVRYVLEAMTLGYTKAGHLIGAQATAERWLACDLPNEDRAQALLARAGVFKSIGNIALANKDIQEALAISPGNIDASALAGELLTDSDPAQAMTYLRMVIEADPRRLQSRLLLARCLRNRGENEAAVTELGKVLSLDPRFVAALVDRAKLRLDSRDFDGSLHDLTTALALDPRNRMALTTLSRTYQQMGREKEAKETQAKVKAIEEHLFKLIREGVANGTIPAPPKGTDITIPDPN